MKTKLFFPLCAMIALPSVANALPAVLKKPGAQTAMAPLCADKQFAANVFKAMPVEEAQTACEEFTGQDAQADALCSIDWDRFLKIFFYNPTMI